jgi:hypothetical protein
MSDASTILDAIVAPFQAASDIATAIDTVATLMDGQRSVVLIVENPTHHALERVEYEHVHGGFKVTPSFLVPALSTAIFGSQDIGFMTGTEGWVRYRVRDQLSEETLVSINWNNPFVGSNSAGAMAWAEGPLLPPPSHDHIVLPSTLYRTLTVCGGGDHDAEMRYTLQRL